MLSQDAISRLFGCTAHTVSNWIMALKTLGMLKLAEPHVPKKTAATYFYSD